MNKTLRISFALRNTYRVNGILYALKQIPLIKRLLPDLLYQVRGLKIFANVLSILWEIVSTFGFKLLYLATMVWWAAKLYHTAAPEDLYLHILLLLTVIGMFVNTHLFNPTRDKYYAIILMRMNAREHTLVNYGYSLFKSIVGFLPFSLLFGRMMGVPVWFCLAFPFCAAASKLILASVHLRDYLRRGQAYNENKLRKLLWLVVGLLLGVAYGLPALGVMIPAEVSMAVMLAFVPVGLLMGRTLLTFPRYREINQELLSQLLNQMDTVKQAAKTSTEKLISADTSITSHRKGFEYLNELFIKRHQKILWKSTLRIAAISCFLVFGGLLVLYLVPESRPAVNELILNWLPYFVFIMYAINRGTGFTRALFMNCDHSLLTYSFYKQPKFVLKLFQIRLREIMKINAVPGLVIGGGLALLLYASGGTDNPLNYGVLFVSIVCMSLFFSVHYLTIYYLLQPYNAGTEMKSGTYRLVLIVTYIVCYAMMRVRLPLLLFGVSCIAFCVVYSILACALIYRLSPKTFRLRT